MPVGGLLIGMSHPQKLLLPERPAQELKTDGKIA
jgi:hypothetical protein